MEQSPETSFFGMTLEQHEQFISRIWEAVTAIGLAGCAATRAARAISALLILTRGAEPGLSLRLLFEVCDGQVLGHQLFRTDGTPAFPLPPTTDPSISQCGPIDGHAGPPRPSQN